MGEPPRKKLLNRWRSECGNVEGRMKNVEESGKETKHHIVRIKETVKKDSSSSKLLNTGPQVGPVPNQTTPARENSLADNVKTRIRFKASQTMVEESGHQAPSMLTSSTKDDDDDNKVGLEKYLFGLSSNWQVQGKRGRRKFEGLVFQSKQNSETESKEVDGDDAIEKITEDVEDCHLDSADVRKAAEIIMDMRYHYLAPKPNSQLSDSGAAVQEDVAPVAVPTLNQQTHQLKGKPNRA